MCIRDSRARCDGRDRQTAQPIFDHGLAYGREDLVTTVVVRDVYKRQVQETAARCGCVTGKGFASLIREKFGARKTALAMVALLIANTAVTISEFAGIASGLALFGIPKTVSVPLMGLSLIHI